MNLKMVYFWSSFSPVLMDQILMNTRFSILVLLYQFKQFSARKSQDRILGYNAKSLSKNSLHNIYIEMKAEKCEKIDKFSRMEEFNEYLRHF